MNTSINKKIYRHFKETIISNHGNQKGIIQEQLECAIKEWISK